MARLETDGRLFAGRLSAILIVVVLQESKPLFPIPLAAKQAILSVAVHEPVLLGVTQSKDQDVDPEPECVALEPLVDVLAPALEKEPLSIVAENPPEPELERLTLTEYVCPAV